MGGNEAINVPITGVRIKRNYGLTEAVWSKIMSLIFNLHVLRIMQPIILTFSIAASMYWEVENVHIFLKRAQQRLVSVMYSKRKENYVVVASLIPLNEIIVLGRPL